MASQIDIISNALILVGDVPVNDLVGNDRRKVVARNLYNSVVEFELTKHRWGFARRKQQLSLLTEKPIDNDYSSAYQLPSDLLLLIKLNPVQDYQVYGRQIYCNYSSTLHADYIYKPDESEWPPYFVKMIEYALAKDFSTSIRDSATSKQLYADEYVVASRMARASDSQQHPQVPVQRHPFIDVRF